MKKKMMKAIKELNAYIDNDRQKLCDELHEIKLSHKRMERLLHCVYDFLKRYEMVEVKDEYTNKYREYLVDKIHREFSYPYFRVNYKMKGGKDA